MSDLRPAVFRLYDALTFGLAAVIATVLVAIAQFNGLNEGVATWRWVGMWAIVAAFWGGYGLVLKWRYDLRRRIVFTTAHGLMFVGDGGSVPPKDEVVQETERILYAWRRVPDVDADDVLARGLLVFVKPMPFELHGKPGRFAGIMRPGADAIAVGMDGRPLSETALGHELGHVILRRSGKPADEASLENMARDHGVPY